MRAGRRCICAAEIVFDRFQGAGFRLAVVAKAACGAFSGLPAGAFSGEGARQALSHRAGPDPAHGTKGHEARSGPPEGRPDPPDHDRTLARRHRLLAGYRHEQDLPTCMLLFREKFSASERKLKRRIVQ